MYPSIYLPVYVCIIVCVCVCISAHALAQVCKQEWRAASTCPRLHLATRTKSNWIRLEMSRSVSRRAMKIRRSRRALLGHGCQNACALWLCLLTRLPGRQAVEPRLNSNSNSNSNLARFDLIRIDIGWFVRSLAQPKAAAHFHPTIVVVSFLLFSDALALFSFLDLPFPASVFSAKNSRADD